KQNQFLLAAVLLGASANLREFALFYFPLIILAGRLHKLSWPRCLLACGLAVLAAVAGMLFWALYDTDNYLRAVVNWYSLSTKEREFNPITAKNFWFIAKYAFDCSCAATLLGVGGLALLLAHSK